MIDSGLCQCGLQRSARLLLSLSSLVSKQVDAFSGGALDLGLEFIKGHQRDVFVAYIAELICKGSEPGPWQTALTEIRPEIIYRAAQTTRQHAHVVNAFRVFPVQGRFAVMAPRVDLGAQYQRNHLVGRRRAIESPNFSLCHEKL